MHSEYAKCHEACPAYEEVLEAFYQALKLKPTPYRFCKRSQLERC